MSARGSASASVATARTVPHGASIGIWPMIPTKPPPRHLSMIRGFHLADFLTLGNAACGVLAIFAVMAYVETHDRRALLVAAALIPLALILDVLDGRVARWRRQHSAMGRELDSLADIISFGVAPAAIAYGAGMLAAWDVVVL